MVRREAPQGLAVRRVGRHQRTAVFAENNDPSSRAQHAAPRRDGTLLRQLPCDLSSLNIDRAQYALRGFVGSLSERAAHVTPASGPLHRNLREDAALVVGLHVI